MPLACRLLRTIRSARAAAGGAPLRGLGTTPDPSSGLAYSAVLQTPDPFAVSTFYGKVIPEWQITHAPGREGYHADVEGATVAMIVPGGWNSLSLGGCACDSAVLTA